MREEPKETRSWTRLSSLAMGAGLALGYGMFASIAARFLYPRAPDPQRLLVSPEREIPLGAALPYLLPSGAEVVIARQQRTGRASDFIALSSTCPHLGCRVKWETQNNRFFCPCHNGVFDPQGRPVSGPPAQSGQALPRYPLHIQDGLLFIEVAGEQLETAGGICPGLRRPGHDPCLQAGRKERA